MHSALSWRTIWDATTAPRSGLPAALKTSIDKAASLASTIPTSVQRGDLILRLINQ
jgi:hypothetical protein